MAPRSLRKAQQLAASDQRSLVSCNKFQALTPGITLSFCGANQSFDAARSPAVAKPPDLTNDFHDLAIKSTPGRFREILEPECGFGG